VAVVVVLFSKGHSGWRSSMMANAARDPYWQAAIRREALVHPMVADAIQNECGACHMPMHRFQANAEAGATVEQ